jgi:hypothetical protein
MRSDASYVGQNAAVNGAPKRDLRRVKLFNATCVRMFIIILTKILPRITDRNF